MSTKEKNKRHLRKMNVSVKTKRIVIMILVTALLTTGINIACMGSKILEGGRGLEPELLMESAVVIMWIVMGITMCVFKTKKSELFVDIEDVYNNNSIDAIGKVLLIKRVLDAYSYQKELPSLEKEVYAIEMLELNEKSKDGCMVALEAEIASYNTYETVFSIISGVLLLLLEGVTGGSKELVCLKFGAILLLLLWIMAYVEDMKRNKFVVNALKIMEK